MVVILIDQLSFALDRYCKDNPTCIYSRVGDGAHKDQFRIMNNGLPDDKDIYIWLEDGHLRGSDIDFCLAFADEYLEPVESPRIADLPQGQAIIQLPKERVKSEPLVKPQAIPGGFRKAERKKAKLRLGITGPAGSGKTMSALLIAGGLMQGDWSKVGIVDTENGSGDLYVHSKVGNVEIGNYNILSLTAPFEVSKYIDAIQAAEEAGISVIILDSISHAWAGVGGLLDKQGKIADKTGNSWAAWRSVTPEHSKFVDAMLQSKIHLIATMRSKTEYVYEDGKVRKVGLAPVAREGMDYEFSIVFELDQNHNAMPTKDRTSMFDLKIFKPGIDTGKQLKQWLEMEAT